jgi:hypothetical protein
VLYQLLEGFEIGDFRAEFLLHERLPHVQPLRKLFAGSRRSASAARRKRTSKRRRSQRRSVGSANRGRKQKRGHVQKRSIRGVTSVKAA